VAGVGVGGRAALEQLAGPALEHASRFDHPGFFAHMDPPTPWMTWAAALWAAAMNQNLLHPGYRARGPAARAAGRRLLAPVFGMGGGHLVPGSTLANLTALWAAREITGARRVICSASAHLSVAKASRLLGLELVEVPVDDRERLRVNGLPDDLSDAIVVLTADTVATGAVDPLSAGRGAAWRHVDAAWAGPLRLSSHAAVLDGVQTADSVAVSAHRWLYQPKESALVLFRDPDAAHGAMSFGGGYLAAPNVGLLGSHGNAALPLAALLLAWGRGPRGTRADPEDPPEQGLARARPPTCAPAGRGGGGALSPVRARLADVGGGDAGHHRQVGVDDAGAVAVGGRRPRSWR
jgi:L-2,4-diaminobutyrate decarboxylase